MARYQFTQNGGTYGEPKRLLPTLLKVRGVCVRDGKKFRKQPQGGTWGRTYRFRPPFYIVVRGMLRAAKVGDLSKFSTRNSSPTELGKVYLIRKVDTPKPSIAYPASPLYDGMPPAPTSYHVGTGVIFCGGACKDDYGNMDSATILGQSARLQKPAMDSFIAAAADVNGIKLTGSWRACSAQSALWAGDPNRYAEPSKTAHTRGLAIDVDTHQFPQKQAAIHAALSKRGWFQARPSDEPWHWSFGIKV